MMFVDFFRKKKKREKGNKYNSAIQILLIGFDAESKKQGFQIISQNPKVTICRLSYLYHLFDF